MRLWGLLALLLWGGTGVSAECRQALALGLDVSGSVDSREYRLQTDGLAAALEHPEVRQAFLAVPGAPVRVAVFEWSGPQAQRLVADWVEIAGPADPSALAARLRDVVRWRSMPSDTAIGAAKSYGAALLAQQTDCWRQVLDLSGDGRSNSGPMPEEVLPPGVIVNGLVISGAGEANGIGALARYYEARVIQGREAFVETALGFPAFEAAMVRKLKRELQVLAVRAGNRAAAAEPPAPRQ